MRNGCEVDPLGTKRWFKGNRCHREDGPAVEYSCGDKYWYIEGNIHRENGPAIEYADGTKGWYLNDKQYTQQEFIFRMRKQKLKNL